MKSFNWKIQYLYHSGFMLESAQNLLIFDYYQGPVNLSVDSKDKNIYVFSSHGHSDHFNPVILEWQQQYPKLKYIFSSDIALEPEPQNPNIRFVSPREELTVDNLKIKTYRSTDLGVAFLINCDGLKIFHAGDLNWWCWWDDTPEEAEAAETSFKEEIAQVKGESIDIAFFPVDPRLRHNFCKGAEYFISEIKPQYLVPMHFGQDFPHEALTLLNPPSPNYPSQPTKVLEITHKGQVFKL